MALELTHEGWDAIKQQTQTKHNSLQKHLETTTQKNLNMNIQ